MPVELFKSPTHSCLAFYDLVGDAEHAVQANQFLVVDNKHGAVIDPGGNMTYAGLLMAMQPYFPSRQLDWLLASHADPDIIASVSKWFFSTECKIAISSLWTRFVAHFTTGKDYSDRIVSIPDAGMEIPVGESHLIAIPAHFLHSEGNFQFYDPIAKILFSGDMGASIVDGKEAANPVTDWDRHLPLMEPFHRRYMVANKICRYWANMVSQLDIEMIVPQHGCRFVGKPMVKRFLSWIGNLQCGVDTMTQDHYRMPRATAGVR